MNACEVFILGAGRSALCMGMQLQRAGRNDVVIVEKPACLGGTWWGNGYPVPMSTCWSVPQASMSSTRARCRSPAAAANGWPMPGPVDRRRGRETSVRSTCRSRSRADNGRNLAIFRGFTREHVQAVQRQSFDDFEFG